MKLLERKIKFARQIPETDGLRILDLCEKYLKIYKDNYTRSRFEHIIAKGIMPFYFYENFSKKISNFSYEELESSKAYVDKYATLIDKILYSFDVLNRPNSEQRENLDTLADLLNFFKKFGYWTDKQIKLIHYKNLKLNVLQRNILSKETELIINSNLVTPYFSNSSTTFEEEDLNTKEKKIVAKKKKTFSLSEIRNLFGKEA